ncbi:putative Branched-chain amino acid transport system permease protein [Pyrodictium delaneyi]|uniref:Branched-chain amino acid ABC transporter permease n=1 Tax=Pyrodictium delaneyi TaxID=1273541 RepID=A0A0P0N3P7_9CREN|nr:branched-chain amino acid ABC transporter permease [Pyrodictium delaneyi]ALL00882.1 putative Branched-chain amino acid transport system permease protein [Pyrodictium delaneyi]OWJ55495.1 branched-chain amino acid ABC transporter permease [Pyrodictium delaneyi]
MAVPVIGVLFEPSFWLWVAIYAIVSLSLNIEAGVTGIPNFGKHLAVLVGAIVAAALPGYLGLALLPADVKQQLEAMTGGQLSYAGDYNSLIADALNKYFAQHPGLSLALFLLVLATAALLGAAVGWLAAYPAARLREEYLAITLLAAAEASMIVAYNAPQLGGTLGLTVPNTLVWLDNIVSRFVSTNVHIISTLIVAIMVAIVVFAYLELVLRSPMGRLLKGVRDNEVAAESLGKDVTKVKLKTLMIGSALAAVAGALFITGTLGWMATSYNRVSWTFWVWAMMILGGMANNIGTLVGTFILVLVRQMITYNKTLIAPYLPFDPAWLDPLILGALLVIVLMVRPQGVLPEKTMYPLPRQKLEEKAKSLGAPASGKGVAR